MSADALLNTLNPAQKEAVLRTDGPLLVLAGAGSGKTRVLTTRLARLVEVHGVEPRNILAVTFTNKAAGEMRDRVGRMLGGDPKGLWIGTFHAIGARMLRFAPEIAGRTKQFTIYDQDDAQNVIKRVMERLRISPKEFTPRAIHSTISDAKNQLVSPTEFDKLALDPFAKAVSQVYHGYEEALRLANATDFDDLLVLPVRLLQQNPQELARYQAKFHYIMVDEYQDTNRAQYQLIKLLGAGHRNVCVVGDDDQSIYGWRGADIRNILDFNKDFPDAAVVRLEENYRSDPPILELANVVISANTERMGKTLRPTRTGGDRVTAARTLDERDEADWVVAEMTSVRRRLGLQLRDLAVLYRTNSQSRAMEESLRRQGTPYRLIGSVRFYDRREIRDLMAYLKLIGNPSDDESFRRAIAVPRRGLGETTIELIAEHARQAGKSMYAAASQPDSIEGLRTAARTALAAFVALIERFRQLATEAAVDELLTEVVRSIDYARYLASEGPEGVERLENVQELITSAAETVADELGEVGLTPLDHFLQRASLVADIDSLDPTADAVLLMTLHNAKGLEFPVVFVTGLEDGLFPLSRAYDDPKMLEEERRLFYVGITRAERKLYLTHAEERRRNGELLPARQSSFLDGIPPAMLDQQSSVKVRSSGRGVMRGAWGMGSSRGPSRFYNAPVSAFDHSMSPKPSDRRPGRALDVGTFADEDASQDAPSWVIGGRVKHRKFGSGTISELAGSGRDAKVKVDFDDETVGRKTLVIAQANLERGDE
ncbi:MAG TPA: UvrD-helicase domain-containing protein [Gemmatimonadaceae bacterium]|nr:UvrD-helicase domain-containing protein [Gemmatimonadaceae bacterium]